MRRFQSKVIVPLLLVSVLTLHLAIAQVTPKAAAGQSSSILLKADGTIWGWGANFNGEVGVGSQTTQEFPVRIGTDLYKDISNNGYHTLALAADGSLWAWGWNYNSQLGSGVPQPDVNGGTTLPVKIGTNTYIKIASSVNHSMAIRSDGTLWTWGENGAGQLGNGSTSDVTVPTQVGTDTYKEISCSDLSSFAIRTDGTLWAWGQNTGGQLGTGTTTNSLFPVQVGTDTDWKKIHASLIYTTALKNDGTRWAWGLNQNGSFGDGTTASSMQPKKIGNETWLAVSTGHGTSHGIKSDGTLWGWGLSRTGEVGNGTMDFAISSPVQIGTDHYISVSTGWYHSLAIRNDGEVVGWGSNLWNKLGTGNTDRRLTPMQVGTDTYTSISAGFSHPAAIKSDGTAWTWGSGIRGYNKAPKQVSADKFSTVYAGLSLFHAIKPDGSLWAWGYNSGQGQLGDGTSEWRDNPVQISIGPFKDVAHGQAHAIALKQDGTLWAWGSNGFGEIGDGTTTNRLTPVQIGSGHYTKVAAAFNLSSSLAIGEDGSVFMWGRNGGMFDDGGPESTLTPTLRHPGIPYKDVQINTAIKADNTLWAGGVKLGPYPPQFYPAPTQISAEIFVKISQGSGYAIGIKSDGTLWGWGENAWGELADGTRTTRVNPIQIGTATYKDVSCGYQYVLALRSDGSLWSWGSNSSGQLGLGFFAWEVSPKSITNVYIKSDPTLTWNNPAPIVYGTALSSLQLNAVANVEGTFTYDPPVNTILNAGPDQVLNVKFEPADITKYNSIPNSKAFITVTKSPQTITFGTLPSKTITEPSFSLSGTASSGLPVTYTSLTTARASINGNTVTMLTAGPTTIRASQPGNSNYDEAASVNQVFCINPRKPTITSSRDASGNQVLTSSNPAGNQWLRDGPIPNATNVSLTVTESGSYSVVTTIDGCSSQVSDNTTIVITGLSRLENNGIITLYPNPTYETLYIDFSSFSNSETVELRIVDLLGRTLFSSKYVGNSIGSVDVSILQKGNYVVELRQNEHSVRSRFVKG